MHFCVNQSLGETSKVPNARVKLLEFNANGKRFLVINLDIFVSKFNLNVNVAIKIV